MRSCKVKSSWVAVALVVPLVAQAAELPGKYAMPPVTEAVQVQAARGVMERLIPGISRNFELEFIPKVNGLDVFELESRGVMIVVRGSSGVALCSGFNWYLKEYGHCHISWCGDQLQLPNPLPTIPGKVRQVSPTSTAFI